MTFLTRVRLDSSWGASQKSLAQEDRYSEGAGVEWEACGEHSFPHGAFAEQTGGISCVFFLFDLEHLVRSLWQVLQWSFGTGRCAPVNVWGRVSNFVLTKVMLVIFLTP